MKSIWMKDYVNKNLPTIEKDTETPVLIIGGGIAGLMCAYNLMKNNINFILVDGRKIAQGVSSKTTAQVSIAHDKLYDEIKKKHSKEKSILYLKNQIEGLSIINQIIRDEKIECDYKEENTILCSNEEKNKETLIAQHELIKKYSEVEMADSSNSIFKYKQGLEFKKQFIFNPMKYMMGIIDILLNKKSNLFENSLVTKIEKKENGYEVMINEKYKIKTPKIVMACHYPILNPDNLYFTKIYQSKSYVIAFETKLKISANYISLDPPYFYIRTYDDKTLIIGGGDHYTGVDIDINRRYRLLIDKIYSLDKDAKIKYKWFTEDCMPIDSLPFIGKYSNKNPDIIIVTGFQKWGFTNSHIAAKNVVDMIIDDNYETICKPKRFTLIKDLKSTIRMVGHSVDGLLLSKLFVSKYKLNEIKIGSGKAMRFNGINVLVYRDSKDDYVFLKNKCTHLGCSLIWNDVDKLWESKCHGSIFDKYGKVVYGPAIRDLEKLSF
ncbi:MAG: FAD-dependent oxidoreductase [Bacilli bacterium]